MSLLFCSATNKHDISSEYFVKLRSLYCCARSMFDKWNVEIVCSIMSLSVICSPHNLSSEVMRRKAELYSLTVL
ncbi:hypothetical protein HanHA300_Chr17g0664071 [Helianthus annuus]|nr:hypothetical protein HanHA300_Chr17g0664071 [Helianthus annuus]